MAQSVLNAPHFQSEPDAFAYVEAHLWPNGPVCPHCGETERLGKLQGKATRIGLYKCYACGKQFTVRIGTIFQDSHLPLHLWLQVIHLFCCSKKGIATRQIQRMLQCSMKTAWHLGHRIRLAMDPGQDTPMGGEGKTVEIDDTEMGRSKKSRRLPEGRKGNIKVLSLVVRGGPIRSIVLDHRGIGPRLHKHLDRNSRLVSDSAPVFRGQVYGQHEAVDHSKYEWARGDVHTNTLEGFFSVFKRGIIGVYQHVDSKHFDRYLAKFDFRMNTRTKLGINDQKRAEIALQGMKGKRLTYGTTLSDA
jgi:transposase-like protein